MISGNPVFKQVMACGGGLIVVGLTWIFSRRYHSGSTLFLVPGGIIVGSVFTSFVMLMKTIADPSTKLSEITVC